MFSPDNVNRFSKTAIRLARVALAVKLFQPDSALAAPESQLPALDDSVRPWVTEFTASQLCSFPRNGERSLFSVNTEFQRSSVETTAARILIRVAGEDRVAYIMETPESSHREDTVLNGSNGRANFITGSALDEKINIQAGTPLDLTVSQVIREQQLPGTSIKTPELLIERGRIRMVICGQPTE